MTAQDLGLVLLSALLHALWSVWIKSSRDPVSFNLIQCWPVPLMLAAVAPWVDFGEVPRVVWPLLGATSVAHALYLYWMSRAYEHGDLSLVYPIARSTPAFLPLVALPVLGEVPSLLGGLGIAVVVAGVWAVQGVRRWRLELLREPAARFAFLTLAATVAYSLVDKAAMAELGATSWSSPVPRSIVYFLLLSTGHLVCYAPLVLRDRSVGALRETARHELGLATIATLISFAGYSLILKAMETALVSYVVAVRQSSVLFALVLGVLMLRERPGRERVIGALATVAGVVLIALFP